MRGLLLGLSGVVFACSSDPASGPCPGFLGSYSLTFTTLSGNCGAVSTQVINFTEGQSVLCPGISTESADRCTTDYDVTCPAGDLGSLREEGTLHLSHDGKTATATEQMTVFNASGALLCSGTYRIGYQKL